jgi:hypothetical protein
MPQLRRAAETARFGQTHKIFKPFGFHAGIIVSASTPPAVFAALESPSQKGSLSSASDPLTK